MMTPAVRSPQGARRVVFAMLACVIALLFLGAWVIRTYTIDRTEDQDQIVALEDAVNALVEQVKQEGAKPVVDNAAEVSPDAPPPPLPGRDGRDGVSPPCLSSPTQCQGADGTRGAVGATGVGATGANGQDSSVPGPPGADSSVPGPPGSDSAVPGPPGPECPAGYTPQDVPAPLPSTDVWRVCVQNPP